MKKKLCVIISAMLAVMLSVGALSGCGKKSDPNVVRAALSYYTTTSFPEGQSATDNIWTREIEEKLGFQIEYEFAMTNDMYTERLNTEIGAGTIPDMFTANINQMPTLIRAKMIYDDLTEIFDTYASDLTKQLMGWDPELKQNSPNFAPAVVDGKLKAIPWVESNTDPMFVMYIRKDWLEDVGETIPKTLDDLARVLRKFKEQKNSKGLAANSDVLYSNAGGLGPIYNAFGAYTNLWVEKEDGTLDYGFFQPELKEALTLLQDWYSQGLIYQEFATTTQDTIGQKIANGEIGVWFGTMSLPLWKMNAAVANFDGADWVAAPAPTNGDEPLKIAMSNSITRYHVVRRGYEYPERLIQMMNLFTENMWGETGDFETYESLSSAFPFQTYPADKNLAAYRNVTAALNEDRTDHATWFESFAVDEKPEAWTGSEEEKPAYYDLNSEDQYYYRNIRSYLLEGKDSDARNWAYTRVFYAYEDPDGMAMIDSSKTGFECSQSVIDYYYLNDLYQFEAYCGFDTQMMSKYRGTVETKMNTLIKNIISGKATVASFDAEIQSLRDGNAGKIIEEVNEQVK